MDLRIEFTDKEITPWGGIVLLKRLVEKTGMMSVLENLSLPLQGSNRGYKPLQLLMSFFVTGNECSVSRWNVRRSQLVS